jgi:hypothetical protein
MGKKRQPRYMDHFLYRIDMKSFLIYVSRHCQTQAREVYANLPLLEPLGTVFVLARPSRSRHGQFYPLGGRRNQRPPLFRHNILRQLPVQS